MDDNLKISDVKAEAWRNYAYDFQRFGRYSSAIAWNADPTAVGAELVSLAHSVEKGLVMADTHAGFAAPRIRLMLDRITFLEQANMDGFPTRSARGVLRAYVRYHDERGLPLPRELEPELRNLVSDLSKQSVGAGWTVLTKAEVAEATAFDYARFVQTRHSVRQFTGEPVSEAEVRTAVAQAIRTPRTRNREMRHVFAAYSQQLRDHLLTFHRGNIGFGHKLGTVLVITVDLRQFDMIGERNQCWIDGGMFAMSLVLAFHAQRLGTCMLNWSADYEQDEVLRSEFNIPDYHVIITLLGVGRLPDRLEVAFSPSPEVDAVLSNLSMRT